MKIAVLGAGAVGEYLAAELPLEPDNSLIVDARRADPNISPSSYAH
ncbi:MAG: hypothetical protein JJU21_13300 [Salinarimonas sp.]|nr:hypothetical protein [Salinarimonas sp.]